MKILVNTRLLLKDRLEGIGWFSFETLKRIVVSHPEHEFFFLFDRPYAPEFVFAGNVTPLVYGPPARHPFLYPIWFECVVPRVIKKTGAQAFITPDGYLSLRSKIPTLQVVHDINHEHYPGFIPALARWYLQLMFPRYVKRADRIATVSEFSKGDIVEHYRYDASKIDVVYNGAGKHFVPVDGAVAEKIKAMYTGGKPYFFYIGSLHPRKNISNLLAAFDEFKGATRSDMKMVIAGKAYWWNSAMEKAYQKINYKEDIIFTGRVDDESLKNLMASAFALTYVSLFEGFGIPLLEAMNCDVPVITSNCSSMPEVGGKAAVYAEPSDPASISDAMKRLWSDSDLRSTLIENGRMQRQKFHWDITASKLWESFVALCHEKQLPV